MENYRVGQLLSSRKTAGENNLRMWEARDNLEPVELLMYGTEMVNEDDGN